MGGRRATVDYQCYIKCAIVYCCILYRRKEFIKNTVTGAVLLTLYLAVLPAVPVDAADYLLAAVYGGAACGAGIGLVLKSGFTTGGTDMLGVLLHRFFRQYALASIIQVLDMAVIIAGVLVFGMSVSLYAIIAVYVTALVTDTVLEGTKQARAVWIISDKNEQIAPVVMEKMHRGITRFPASGVYTQQEKVCCCAWFQSNRYRI